MRNSSLILILLIPFCLSATTQNDGIIYTKQDSSFVNHLLADYPGNNNQIEKMTYFGEKLIGIPYVPNKLDNTGNEKLVINLYELDCTTFVETILALSLASKEDKANFETFASQLKRIRYRDGEIKGYTYRLHYFSDWIANNSSEGIIKEITGDIRGAKKGITHLSYMSDHPDKYALLVKNPQLTMEIYKREQSLNGKSYFYIDKKNMTPDIIKQIKKGDIIAVTTNIPGLDISHVGVAYPIEGDIYMLHASQQRGKVILDRISLKEYLNKSRLTNGIRIIRPLL